MYRQGIDNPAWLLIAALWVACSGSTRDAGERTSLTYAERNGQVLYQRYCVHCHGVEGDGNGLNAINLEQKPAAFRDAGFMQTRTDENLRDVIQWGGPAQGHSVLMPAWGNTLQERQVQYLIRYIRTFSRPEPPDQPGGGKVGQTAR